jgi:hypothetical protein
MHTIVPSIEDQMTQIYVFVDDYLKAHPTLAKWRRSPNAVDLPPCYIPLVTLVFAPVSALCAAVAAHKAANSRGG